MSDNHICYVCPDCQVRYVRERRDADRVTVILASLIAELRDVFGTDAEAYGERFGTFPIGSHGDEVRRYLDRAEARLREASGDADV